MYNKDLWGTKVMYFYELKLLFLIPPSHISQIKSKVSKVYQLHRVCFFYGYKLRWHFHDSYNVNFCQKTGERVESWKPLHEQHHVRRPGGYGPGRIIRQVAYLISFEIFSLVCLVPRQPLRVYR